MRSGNTSQEFSPRDEEHCMGTGRNPNMKTGGMPIMEGMLFEKTVSILQDTGSNNIVMCCSLVPDETLTVVNSVGPFENCEKLAFLPCCLPY